MFYRTMTDNRRRGRSESIIKLALQRKESKLRYEEANCHVKGDNFFKALESYSKVGSGLPWR